MNLKDRTTVFALILILAFTVVYVVHAFTKHAAGWVDVAMYLVPLIIAAYFIFPESTAKWTVKLLSRWRGSDKNNQPPAV